MSAARYLVVGLLAVVGMTACDHSSRRTGHTPRPYTTRQVREAFAAGGIHLKPGLFAPRVIPGLRTILDGEGGVEVVVFKTSPAQRHVVLNWMGPGPVGSEHAANVVVLYPKHTRVLPKIRRAIARLRAG